MNLLHSDGTLNSSQVTREILHAAKTINDTIYYCFDDIDLEKRITALEAYNRLLNLAKLIEGQENEFFRI